MYEKVKIVVDCNDLRYKYINKGKIVYKMFFDLLFGISGIFL